MKFKKTSNPSPVDGTSAFDRFGTDARSDARMLSAEEKITDEQRSALISELCDWRESHRNGAGKPLPWAELGAKIGVSGSTLVEIRKGTYKADDSHVLRRVDEFLADERVRIGRFDARTFSRIDLTHKIKGAIAQSIKHNTIGVIIGEPGSGKSAHAHWFVGQRENAVLVEPDDVDCDQRWVIDSIYKALGLFGRNQRFRRDKKRAIVDYLKRHKSTVIVIDEAQKLTRSALEMLRRLHDLSDPQGLRNVAVILFADEDFYRLIVRSREGQRTPISAQISRRLYPIFDIATHGCDRNSRGESIGGTVYKPSDIEAVTRNQRLRVFDGRDEIAWLVRLANVRGHGALGFAMRVFEIAWDIRRGKRVTISELSLTLQTVLGPDEARLIDDHAGNELLASSVAACEYRIVKAAGSSREVDSFGSG